MCCLHGSLQVTEIPSLSSHLLSTVSRGAGKEIWKHHPVSYTCRAPATVPPGGVSALQVNFYFTEEALEQARSDGSHSLCPVHTKEFVLHCKQCKQAICLLCKLTKHEGHVTEELSQAAARSKKTIEDKRSCFLETIEIFLNKSESCQQNEKRAQEKQTVIMEEIQVRYDVILAMAGKYRDTALQELKKMSNDLKKDLAADSQRVQNELSSLLSLEERVQRAVSSTCYTEVLQVERDMREGEGSAKWLKQLKGGLPNTTYRPGLHGDFTNDIEDCIKRFIGSTVKLKFPTKYNSNIVRVGRCGDGKCREVISFRQKEDKVIEAYYGGPGSDVSKVGYAAFDSNGFKTREERQKTRVSCVTRKFFVWKWKTPGQRYFGSKGEGMHSIFQDCSKGYSKICSLDIKQDNGKEMNVWETILLNPNVHTTHNFDSTKQGLFFALVDEDNTSNNQSKIRNEKSKSGSRVVRLYSNKSDDPIATYTSPIKPFFPTDVCFYGKDFLLIADWTNDCVHVVKVTDNDLRFISYLPGSGDFVRLTALNLDLQDRLLIGCGDGWILKCSVDI